MMLSQGDEIRIDLFSNAFAAVQEVEQALLLVDIADPDWQQAAAVASRIVLAADMGDLITGLREEMSKRYAEPVQIGVKTAIEMLEAGSETIYNPQVWIVYNIWDPRQIIGAGSALVNKVKDKVVEAGKADAIGAVAGALGGAAKGAIFGGGVAVSAGGGAVAGGVAASTKSVLD